MANRIGTARVALLDGVLDQEFHFEEGLNILAGENGTLKTKVLTYIKDQASVMRHDRETAIRVEAISPKRNHDLRTTEQILSALKQSGRTWDKLLTELTNLKMNDKTFARYPSFGELFYSVYEDVCRSGGNRQSAMQDVVRSFNAVIARIFPDYEVIATWDDEKGNPVLRITKGKSVSFPLDGLSLGESEVLAVALNLYAFRESYDVYLIDEPENHLNWHLESMLFAYFSWFCETYGKQLIVATHSRAVFRNDFLRRTRFLEWTSEGSITILEVPSDQVRERLAGEAVSIIQMGEFPRTTFFVEDQAHENTLKVLSESFGISLDVVKCDRSDVVKTLYKYSLTDGGWSDAYFLVDGDNQGNQFPGDCRFIHLDAYCIENYLIAPGIVAELADITEADVRSILLESIHAQSTKILGKRKWCSFLLDRLVPADLTEDVLKQIDGSELLPDLIKRLSMSQDNYIRAYVKKCRELEKLQDIFPESLLAPILSQTTEPEV